LAKRTAKVDTDRAVIGNSQQLVDQLNTYAADGFDEFIVLTATLGRSAEERRDSIERFASEVTANLG
jgi:alkanesulfonate monooxygenase SsuD/methylene tetrahydromethanopterin reductase-like flavin-dependent oxidoreductase (luciferase family)